MNIATIQALVEKQSGHKLLRIKDTKLAPIRGFLGHPDIDEYVRNCLPPNDYLVSESQLAICCLDNIIAEMHPQAGPGGLIGRFGYLVVATSAGGNVVCFHSPTGRVFWADHEAFADGGISYKNHFGERVFLEKYSPEDVERAMVRLSENIEEFIIQLLTDKLTEQLRILD